MKETWIIPCNTKFFKVVEHFEAQPWAIWKKGNRGIATGDDVFIYVGVPYSEILYKCVVVDDNVDKAIVAENAYAIQKEGLNGIDYIKIELIERFEHGVLTRELLKKHGLGQVQMQARASRRLAAYLLTVKGKRVQGGDTDNA